jgi:uncharacterized membrane protein
MVGVTGIALLLRLHDLGRLSLWLDEGITAYKISLPIQKLFAYTELDNVPPLYYLVLHVFRSWIHSDFALRLPSALFGVATIPVLFLIGRALFESRVAVLSCFLLSLSTFHVWFSQEARSYCLYYLCFALSLLFLVRWNRSIESSRDWWGYVLFSSLMAYTHSTAILYWLTNQVVFACLAGTPSKKKLHRWLLAQFVIGLLFLPWLPSFLQQSHNYSQDVTLGRLHYSALIETLMILTSPAPLYASEVGKLVGHSDLTHVLNLTWIVGFFGAFSIAILRLERPYRQAFLAAISVALVPIFLVTLFSIWVRNIFFDRLFLPSTLGVSLLLALGLRDLFDLFVKRTGHALVSLVLACIVSSLSILSLIIYYKLDRKEDFRSAANFLAQRYEPHDLVLFVTHSGEALFDWYHGDRRETIRRSGIPYGYQERPNQSPGHVVRYPSDIVRLRELSLTAQRIWLIRLRTQYHDPQELTYHWMEEHLKKVASYPFSGVRLDLYTQGSGKEF